MQKVQIMNCLILFCKGERLGLLTPNLVVYPKIMWTNYVNDILYK
jgi:hypothetical protein